MPLLKSKNPKSKVGNEDRALKNTTSSCLGSIFMYQIYNYIIK